MFASTFTPGSDMKYLIGIVLYVAFLVPSSSAQAQQYTDAMTSCLSTFYNSGDEMYLRNGCDEDLSVLICPRNGGECFGISEVDARGTDGTGQDRDDVAKAGGLRFYACRSGYLAVDADGHMLQRAAEYFRCKKKF
jgi:hypothetical protein